MQSPSVDVSESERRARLLELEERQRRLQQLCEEALKEEEQQQRVLEQLGTRNASFAGAGGAAAAAPLSRPPPPSSASLFSQSPDRQLNYSLGDRRPDARLAPPLPASSYTSRGGGAGPAAPYTEDLLTGEVQSFRDPNSIARASSINTNRDPSLPQGYTGSTGGGCGLVTGDRQTQPPPPSPTAAPAAGAAQSVSTLYGTRGMGSRYQAPPPVSRNSIGNATRIAPPPPPPPAAAEQYVRDRLDVGSGERGYRRYPSNGMVDTPVYRTDPYAPSTLGATGASASSDAGNNSRSGADFFGGARKAGQRSPGNGPHSTPPPPPRSRSRSGGGNDNGDVSGGVGGIGRRPAPEGTRYYRHPVSLSASLGARAHTIMNPPPPPPPVKDGDREQWGKPAGRSDARRVTPPPPTPTSGSAAPFLAPPSPAPSAYAPTGRRTAPPGGPSERRRALRERYGVGTGASKQPLQLRTARAPVALAPPVVVNSPAPKPPTTLGLFDPSDEELAPYRARVEAEEEEERRGAWQQVLHANDTRIRAGPRYASMDSRPRSGNGRTPPPPAPPAPHVQDDVNNKYSRFHPRGGRAIAPAKDQDGASTNMDPWDRPSLTGSMISAEERALDNFFTSPWRGDDTVDRRSTWQRGRDALNAATAGRAVPSRRAQRPPSPSVAQDHSLPLPRSKVGVGRAVAPMKDGMAGGGAGDIPADTPTDTDSVASSTRGRAKSQYPNGQKHPYGGDGSVSAPRQITAKAGAAAPSLASAWRPTDPSKGVFAPLQRLDGNRGAQGVNASPAGTGGKACLSHVNQAPPAENEVPSAGGYGVGGRSEDGGVSSAGGFTDPSPSTGSARPSLGLQLRPELLQQQQQQSQSQPHGDLAFFDEDPGKAALRDFLQKPPLVPVHSEQQQQAAPLARTRSASARGGAYHSPALQGPASLGTTGDESLSQISGRKHSKISVLDTSISPLPATAAQAEVRRAQQKAEALARHLVKAIQEKKMLQESVEQLEELVEESNFEVGRLQRVVEEQHGESHTTQALQAALRSKEREIAVCEDEIQRLSSIVDAHVLRLASKEERIGGAVDGSGGLVAHAVELDAAMMELGVAHLNQREAEERAEQLSSELEAAVEQIRALDERLAEMERAATAARLQEMRSDLRAGGGGGGGHAGSNSLPAQSQPHQLRTPTGALASTAGVQLPSVGEAAHWPASARQALAQVVTHAEGLLAQNAEGSRHAAQRLQHLEYSCEDLQRRLQEKQAELSGLQNECLRLRKDKSTIMAVGDQWFKQLQEVKADAQLVSEVVRTSRGEAEDVLVSCRTADAHVAEIARAAASSPLLPTQSPSPDKLAALHEKNSMAKDFAQQVMRDMHAVARFLAALREMDIGETSGYQVLLALAKGQSPSDRLRLTAPPEGQDGGGDRSPRTVRAWMAGHEAIVERVREKRDFVVQAVERALEGDLAGATPTVPPYAATLGHHAGPAFAVPARRLELRPSSSVRSTHHRHHQPYSGDDFENMDKAAVTQPGEWIGDFSDADEAVSDSCVPADGFEIDDDHHPRRAGEDAAEVEREVALSTGYRGSSYPTRPPPSGVRAATPASIAGAPNAGEGPHAGLVASGLRSDRDAASTAAALSSSVPLPTFPPVGEADPLEDLGPPQQQHRQPTPASHQPQPKDDFFRGYGSGRAPDSAPVARPLRLSSTSPERHLGPDEAAMRGGAPNPCRRPTPTAMGRGEPQIDGHYGGGWAGPEKRLDATFVSSPSTSPPPQDQTEGESSYDADDAAAPERAERPRQKLRSPTPDRNDDGDDDDFPVSIKPSVPPPTPPPPVLATDSVPSARRPAASGRSPGEDDDDSPHLARPVETTAAYESGRQSGANDRATPLTASRDSGRGRSDHEEKRSASPPAAPVPAGSANDAAVVTADSPLKSKSASIDYPAATRPKPYVLGRDADAAPSVPKERSKTAPPLSDDHRSRAGSAGSRERAVDLGNCSDVMPLPRRRASEDSDSDYDEATLFFSSGGGQNSVQEVRMPPARRQDPAPQSQELRDKEKGKEKEKPKATESARSRSMFNRIAVLDTLLDHEDGSHSDTPAAVAAAPAPRPAEDGMPSRTNSNATSVSRNENSKTALPANAPAAGGTAPFPGVGEDFEKEVVAYLEDRPPARGTRTPDRRGRDDYEPSLGHGQRHRATAPHAGRRLPGEEPPSTVDNLDNISSIYTSVISAAEDSAAPSLAGPRAPTPIHDVDGSGPVGSTTAAAAAPLPPRLQRSVRANAPPASQTLGPTSANQSGRETPLERQPVPQPPLRRSSLSPTPLTGSGNEPSLPPSLPQPQRHSASPTLPRSGSVNSNAVASPVVPALPLSTLSGNRDSSSVNDHDKHDRSMQPLQPSTQDDTHGATPPGQVMEAFANLGPDAPPEVPLTAIPSSRRGRTLQSSDLYDRSTSSSSRKSGSPVSREVSCSSSVAVAAAGPSNGDPLPASETAHAHRTAFTGPDDTREGEGADWAKSSHIPTTVIPVEDDMELDEDEREPDRPTGPDCREDHDDKGSKDRGGLGLPSAPAPSADAVPLLDISQRPQPAAPLPMEPQSRAQSNSSGGGGGGNRLPPRAGARPSSTSPEVCSLPRVNVDETEAAQPTARMPVSATTLMLRTTRGRPSSTDPRDSSLTNDVAAATTPPVALSAATNGTPEDVPGDADASNADAAGPPPARSACAPEGSPSPPSKVSSALSSPRSTSSSSRLYDPEAMQRRREDVAKILKRLKDKKSRDQSLSEASSATPSPLSH